MEQANATTVLGRPPQLSNIHNNYPTLPLNSSKYKKSNFDILLQTDRQTINQDQISNNAELLLLLRSNQFRSKPTFIEVIFFVAGAGFFRSRNRKPKKFVHRWVFMI